MQLAGPPHVLVGCLWFPPTSQRCVHERNCRLYIVPVSVRVGVGVNGPVMEVGICPGWGLSLSPELLGEALGIHDPD